MPTFRDHTRDGEGREATPPGLFDVWLQTRLQSLYDRTLDEALPESLLLLVPEPGHGSGSD